MTRVLPALALTPIIIAFMLGLASDLPSAAADPSNQGPSPATSESDRVRVFVTFAQDFDGDGDRADRAEEELMERDLLEARGGSIRHRYELVDAVAADIEARAVDALAANPRIVRVEPDGPVSATIHIMTSGDTELNASWGVKHIGSGPAHNSGQQGAGVKVAILDTGVNRTHVDLDANYNASCSYDFVNADSDPTDDHGHGSHVSGIAGAENNDTGVVGVAPRATLCVYKVLGADGSGSWSNVLAGLERAASDGAKVVNLSLGSSGDPGQTVAEAFTAAYNSGLIMFAAAGNSGECAGTSDTVEYPARYPEVIAVAATDGNDISPCSSSTGPDVELSAPGVSVQSAWKDSATSYTTANGTSMASPHAAGLAALLLGCNPILTNIEVRDILAATAKDLDSPLAPGSSDGKDTWHGHGLIQASAALAAAGPCVESTPAPTATPVAPTATATPTRTWTPTATQTPSVTKTPTLASTPGSWRPRCVDVNGDGWVRGDDVSYVVLRYGTSDPRADLDGNGTVSGRDITIALSQYGYPCSP